MLKLITVLLASTALLTGCGYDGHYRYPCQDPANWESEECQPPICTAAGACPEDLVGPEVLNGTSDTTEEAPNE